MNLQQISNNQVAYRSQKSHSFDDDLARDRVILNRNANNNNSLKHYNNILSLRITVKKVL